VETFNIIKPEAALSECYILYYRLYMIHYRLYMIHYRLYMIRYRLYMIHYRLYMIRYRLYMLYYRLYMLYYRLYMLYYRLYMIHCVFVEKLKEFNKQLPGSLRCVEADLDIVLELCDVEKSPTTPMVAYLWRLLQWPAGVCLVVE